MKGHFRTLVGVALSLALLAWAVRDVSLAEVTHEMSRADPGLFLFGVLISLAGLAIRAVRWGILLRPLGVAVPFRPRFASVMIGFAANNVLPARIGEFARALSLSRLTPVATGASFASLVVERIFDAMVLIGLLFATMASADFPATGDVAGIDPRAAARAIAVAMAAVAAVLFAMVFAPRRFVGVAERVVGPLPESFRRPLLAALHSFLAGLAVLRDARLFALSAGLAIFQWLFTAVSFFVTFRAFGIVEVPFSGAVFLQSLLSLAVSIPSSPGFFGPFEAAAALGLSLWSVGPEKAVPFAIGLHLGGFIPVTLIGMYYVARLNLSWRDMRQSEELVEDRVEAGAEPVGPR